MQPPGQRSTRTTKNSSKANKSDATLKTPAESVLTVNSQTNNQLVTESNANTDDEGFQTVHSKRHSRRNSTASTESNGHSPNFDLNLQPITVLIENLEAKETAKSFHTALKQFNLAQFVVDMKFWRNSVKLTTYQPDFETQLKKTIGTTYRPEATIKTLNSRVRPKSDSKSHAPLLSVVITNVDHDVTDKEVEEELKLQGYKFKKAVRIFSRLTQKPIKKIRVISDNKDTIDKLLAHHFRLHCVLHRVEPSNPLPPQPTQCRKCNSFQHTSENCRNEPKCGKCSGPHLISSCKLDTNKEALKCSNCNGNHLATDLNCTERPKQPISADKTEKIKCIDEPIPPLQECSETENFLRAFTTALLNILPERRSLITETIKTVSKKFLRRDVEITHAWNNIHIFISQPSDVTE